MFLHVVGRRPDGYHLLQSAFELIDWYDRIEIGLTPGPDVLRQGDLLGPAEEDLAVRAAKKLQQTPEWARQGRPGARITVHKSIPAGAGLGGGSSDAATTLMGLNRLWGLGLDRRTLSEIGLSLGADVPFFLFGQAAFAQGVGEELEPYAASPRVVVMAVPNVSVATAEIFRAPELTRNSKPLKITGFAQAATSPVWDFGRNDLEPVTRSRFPEVDLVLNRLSQAAVSEEIAPLAVRMSGSGGAVFCTAPNRAVAHRVLDRMKDFQKTPAGRVLAQVKICQTLIAHPEQRI